jgi:hypothetical protein
VMFNLTLINIVRTSLLMKLYAAVFAVFAQGAKFMIYRRLVCAPCSLGVQRAVDLTERGRGLGTAAARRSTGSTATPRCVRHATAD